MHRHQFSSYAGIRQTRSFVFLLVKIQFPALRPRQGPLVLVGDDAVDGRFKEGEHGEPDACSHVVRLLQHTVVGKRVIIEEESRRDVEANEHVDGVMLMGSKDEENAEHVHYPRCNVYVVQAMRNVCKTEQQRSWLTNTTIG